MRTNIFSLLKNQKSVVLALWAAVVLLLAVPQGAWAEQHTVTYNPSLSITWAQWQTYNGNNNYVTLMGDGSPTVTSAGNLRITETQGSAKKVTFTLVHSGIYIGSYSYIAYQEKNGNALGACYAYFKDNGSASSSNKDVTITNASQNSWSVSSYNKKSLYISMYNQSGYTGFLSTQKAYGAINNVVLNLLIPEVKTASNGQTAPTDKSWVDKTWAKNTEKSITIKYDVKDAVAKEDFSVAVDPNAGNKGTMTASVTSYSDNQLTVTVKYKTKNGDDFAENFSGVVTVSSVNTLNTATYSTNINGTAGNILQDNALRFDISAAQFVNTHYTTAVHTYTNSEATVTYSSSKESVAYFDDEDQTLHIVGVGSAKLTATQSATTEIKSGSAELTITVSKRTANFVYTPSGNLYTSHNYPGFVTVDNDPNNSLPQLTYTSDMTDKFKVDADGTAHTYAVTANPTLTITANNAIEKSTNGIRWQDEWNTINVSHPVTIVKDPTTVAFCMSDAYVELGDPDFCRVTSTDGEVTWSNNSLKIGTIAGETAKTSVVSIHFKGIPQNLTFAFNRPNDGIKDNLFTSGDFSYTLTIKESADGSSWSAAKYTKNGGQNDRTGSGTVALSSSTRYLQISYTGCVYVYFTELCVTAATDMTVDPTSLSLEATASGTTGKFTITHSNMENITITSSNTAFTVDQSTFSFTDGLGIGAYGEIDVTVSYDGSKPVAASDKLTITGTKVGGGTITREVALSVIHPTHYVRAIATVQAGQGKVFVNTTGTTPASGDYVTPSKLVDTNCEAAGSDNIDFYFYAQPESGWNFAGWRETPAAMDYIDQPNDAYLKQTFAALSKNSGSPTTYNRYAIFFRGYPSAPVFRLENLNLADTKSGQSVGGTLVVEGDPSGRPKYIVANEVSIEFEDVTGHTGEAAKFSAGTYNKGTHSFPITFDPSPNQHLTDRTYQAKAVVTATNDEYDENGDFLQKRTTTHECLVTVVCHPADMVSFSVPEEIDFGYVETVTQLGSALVLSNVENMVGEPTLTLSNTVFAKVLYDEISHTFALGYEFHAGQEGQLTATATVTAYNYDGVGVTSDPITLKVVANKPQFTVNDLSIGSMVSGDEPIHAYLPLGNPHGIDPTQVTINITDAPGHSGESSVFSSLAYDAAAQSFYITFAPVGAHVDDKNYQAQATISATNIVGTTSITVLLNATVLTSAPATYTVATSHAFGSLQRNQSETWQAVLSNIENAGEELPTINFDGPNASYFSASAYDPVSHSFTITFTPLAVNPSCSATAHVIVKNYDGKPTEKTITLTGTCIAAPAATFDVQNAEHESVVGTGVYFGDFNEGDAATRTLYIANLLNIKEGTVPAISIAPDGKFAAAAYNTTTQSFDVTFTALPGMETVQNAVATFTVLNNDDQVTEKTVPLSAFVVQAPDFDVRVTDSEGNLIEGGETTWALGLALANKAANAGCTVTLMRAVTGLAAYQEIKNTFTLDLNGKKLSGKNNGSIIYVNGAGKTLTIKDSKSDGRIENINNTYTGIAYGVNVTAGSLILHSGTIYVENKGASGRKAVGILNKLGTEVTINGGKVEVYGNNDSYGIYQGDAAGDNVTFTLNNGEITIEGATTIMGIHARGNVNINGGIINATATTRYSYGIRLYASSSATLANNYWGKLNMTGGTINSTCTNDVNDTREAYGVFFDCANTAMETATATDGSHTNKAAAVGTISNATINVTTNSRYSYGVLAYGSYQSKTNTYDKIKINNSTINSTAKYYYAYGVYACGGVNGTHGAKYFANIELTDCSVTTTTNTYAYSYAVWAYASSATVFKNSQPNYYGEYAGGATITINSGTYIANAETSNAYAVGTSARAKTIYDSETSVSAERKLGEGVEGYATLNIHGGTFRANTKTSTARAVSNGGNCTIDGGEFYATTGTTTATGIYTVSGKLKATGVKIDVTSGTNTAYGVLVDVAGMPTGNQAWTGYTYYGDAELNNLDVTVTTSTATEARGVFVNSTVGTYTQANFDAQKTTSKWSDDTYTIYSSVFPGDNYSRAVAGKVVINGGKYSVTAATTTAYGVYLNQTSVSGNKLASAAAEGTIKNATFDVKTNGTTSAFGLRSGGNVTVDGCKFVVQPKTTTAYGVFMDNNKATITNSTFDVKGTTTAYGLYANASINSTNGYDYHGEFDLGAGNNITAAATAGNTAHVLTLIASKRNIASGTFAGDYANAASAIVRDGSYKATATGTTTYVLNLSAKQVQGAATAAPSCTIEGGKFWAAASGGTQGVCTSNGVAGNILIKGGVYNINTYLGTFLAPGYDEVPLESGRAEYKEGYRYEVLPAGPHGTYVCQIGTGTKYKTLEEALTAVKSGEVIHMLANYTLPAGDYILPTGATLIVPYKDGTGQGASEAISKENKAKTTTSATTPYLFRKLTFASGATLTCQGSNTLLETCAEQRVNGQYGACVGMPSGAYGQIHLEEGAHIELESGSRLNCWGYITGKGTINVKNGATSLEGFQLGDWCGGSNASSLNNNSDKVFPITHYFYQSIECPITYRPGAKALGSTHVYAASTVAGQDAVGLVGTSGSMFLMTPEDASKDTWVMKDYDETTDQCIWTINNGASVGNLSLSMSAGFISYNFQSSNYDLPITTNMTIVMNYGEMGISQNSVLLPGSQLIVNKEGTAKIDGVSLVAYDVDDWTGTKRYFASYSPTWGTNNPRKNIAVQDAEVFVHGKVNIKSKGGLYTTAGGANVHSTNEDAGEVIYTTAAQGNKTTKYLQQGGTTRVSLTAYPAMLKNGVGIDPAFSESAGTVAGRVWTYYDDKWQSWTQEGCLFKDAQAHYYVKPDALVRVESDEPNEDDLLYYDYATGARRFVWDENCYWWEVNPTPVDEGIYRSINEDHNGKLNCYEFDEDAECWKIKNVTVTFSGTGVTSTNYSVGYGTKPKWFGATPTQSGYVWDGWQINGAGEVYSNNDLPAVTTNTTFTSHFKSNPVLYNITFKNPDGTVLDSRNWEKNSTPSYEGTPTQNPTAGETYTWNGTWSPTITTATAAKEYTAQYNSTTRQYDVTFLDYNNEELETKKVNYNVAPTYTGDPSTPTREDPTDTYIYEFSGWKNQQTGTTGLAAVKGDQTYVAQYTHHKKWFNIRFVDYNGTTLQTGPVLRNTMPTPPANPTRESDAQYDYSFKAWSPTIVAATENATYTATYNMALRSYTVRFLNYDGTVLQTETLDYGTTPSYKGETPTNADESKEFVGWDDVMRSVDCNKDYTAQYTTKTYTITVTSAGNGSVAGGGVYSHGSVATLTATPEEGFVFDHWNDDNTDNPRSLTVTETATYTATFISDETGSYLDIVDATATTLTINATTLALSNWPYTINGISYGRKAGSGDQQCNEDRTITIPHDKAADAQLLITVQDKNSTLMTRRKYTIPHVYESSATLSGVDENSIIFVRAGTLTVNANTTVKNIYVAPGAKLVVNSGKTLTADNIYLRTTPWASAELELEGTISGQVSYTRIIADKSQYFQFGLPQPCAIADVRLSDGSTPVYGNGWLLRSYSESHRATYGAGAGVDNWVTLTNVGVDITIQRCVGYEMFSNSSYYREYYFPVAHTGLVNSVAVSHSSSPISTTEEGWNIVTSPLMRTYTHDPEPEGIAVSWLQEDGSYVQEPVTEIRPAIPFSYQAKGNGYIYFDENMSAPAPRRVAAADEPERIQWIHIDVEDANEVGDQTSIYVHPTRYDESYQSGIDVAKQSLTATRAIIYSSHAYGDMAFAGVSDASLEQGVALTVYNPSEQELTFSLRENNWLNRMAYVWLVDTETGAQIDLLESDYNVLVPAGTTRGRFYISGLFKAPQITTDNDVVQSDDEQGTKVEKLLINQKMYIKINGVLYDATGKKVNK